jgi:amidohydrolase
LPAGTGRKASARVTAATISTSDDARRELKSALDAAIERRSGELCALGEDIFDHPELGFREERTSTLVAQAFRELGLSIVEGLAVTGVRAELRGARPGPTVAIIGELDALPVPGHPRADTTTGAAHACGHNAQLVHLLGVARALCETEAVRHLAGRIVFLAVPAEEYVDLEWRSTFARRGKIEFLGGKPELVRLGVFDDIDMALMVHASGDTGDHPLSIQWAFNGFITKRIRFIGQAAHAGVAPFRGINALNAATLALNAVALARETFRDEDHIRVHPIMTHGGTAINIVPSDVRLETFVRGASIEAITDAAGKVDRAMQAGALAVGAQVEIQTLPGYLPMLVDRALGEIFRDNAVELVGADGWAEADVCTASTDAGDLSQLLPMLHPSHGGCAGYSHTVDFAIVDGHAAYVTPTKAVAATVVDLLFGDARGAHHVRERFVPKLTRDTYLATMRALTTTQTFSYRTAPARYTP